MLTRQKWTISMITFLIITLILPCFLIAPVLAEQEKVSIDVRNADIRDVLSAVAVNMDKNIIFAGQSVRISVNLQDVDAETALDYVLNIGGFEYIDDGSALIVGQKNSLSQDFYDQISITKLTLKHITSDIISEQIDVLGLPVKKIVLENNPNVIWIQGLPREINKIKDLISMLDSSENFTDQSGETTLLTPLTMKYIRADQLNSIIVEMGLARGIVLESNPMTLWIHGSSFTVSQIQAVQNNVDIPENSYSDSTSITPVKLIYLTTDEIILILNQLELDVDVLTFEKSLKTLWIKGSAEAINTAKDIIKKFDIKDYSNDKVFFVYNTVNITAQELENRIRNLNLNNVDINYLNYPQFSKSLIIQCPTDYKLFLMSYINELDVVTEKIKVPIDYSNEPSGRSYLKNRLNLIVDLTGIPSSSFKITNSVSRDGGHYYIMYLEETPENIKLVKEYIKYIDNPLSD